MDEASTGIRKDDPKYIPKFHQQHGYLPLTSKLEKQSLRSTRLITDQAEEEFLHWNNVRFCVMFNSAA